MVVPIVSCHMEIMLQILTLVEERAFLSNGVVKAIASLRRDAL